MFRHRCISPLAFAAFLFAGFAHADSPNYHLVGWFNTFIPGGGQFLLGNFVYGGAQAVAEVGTFYWGYSMSKLSPMSLDGVPADVPTYKRLKSGQIFEADIEKPLYADLLQEFGIKYHFVNTFESYRQANQLSGIIDQNIDQRPILDMFLDPFKFENLSDLFVWLPLAIIMAETAADYFTSQASLQRSQQLTPYSNFLYSLNYEIWEPTGSGAPEEMFYRGFMQNEFLHLINSPFFAIPAQALIFTFSHAPGPGRINAGLGGLYFGFLAYKNKGNLGKGIALHFWADVLMGIETALLNHDAQHTSPPATFYVQIDY